MIIQLPTRAELLAAALPVEVHCGTITYRYRTEAARDNHLVEEQRVMTSLYAEVAKVRR